MVVLASGAEAREGEALDKEHSEAEVAGK